MGEIYQLNYMTIGNEWCCVCRMPFITNDWVECFDGPNGSWYLCDDCRHVEEHRTNVAHWVQTAPADAKYALFTVSEIAKEGLEAIRKVAPKTAEMMKEMQGWKFEWDQFVKYGDGPRPCGSTDVLPKPKKPELPKCFIEIE